MIRRGAIVLLLAACSSGRPRGPLSEEERLYRAKCTSCHRTYEPDERPPQAWAGVLDKMEAEKKVRLSQEERAQILGYLSGDKQAQAQPGLR